MKRYIVYGAGAIGGAIGGRLLQAGADVTFIARGANLQALKEGGMRLRTPSSDDRLKVDVVGSPDEARIGAQDIVVLAVKTQDTAAALQELVVAVPDTIILCAQNGVENERLALRQFSKVYGGFVFIASAHMKPGHVDIYTGSSPGILDIGRVPGGADSTADQIARDLKAAGFDAVARPDIMAWKRAKLLMNLNNGLQAVSGSTIAELVDLARLAGEEGKTCLDAALLSYVPSDQVIARLGSVLNFSTIDGQPFPGGSSWQSMARGTSSEVAYLNGEIVLIGRELGIPTPINLFLHETVQRMVRDGSKPGTLGLDELYAALTGLTPQQCPAAVSQG